MILKIDWNAHTHTYMYIHIYDKLVWKNANVNNSLWERVFSTNYSGTNKYLNTNIHINIFTYIFDKYWQKLDFTTHRVQKLNSEYETLSLSIIDKTLKLLEGNKRENIIYLALARDEKS